MPKITFYPKDIHLKDDTKIRMLRICIDDMADAIYNDFLDVIYSTNSYYMDYSDNILALVVSGRKSWDLDKVKLCFDKCLELGLFSKALFEKYGIVTSKGIQDRYFYMAKISRWKNISVDLNYLLIEIEDFDKKVAEGKYVVESSIAQNSDASFLAEYCSADATFLVQNATFFEQTETETKTETKNHTIPSIVCGARTRDFVEEYSSNFLLWWSKYGHSPYSDSKQHSWIEWSKLTGEEQCLCLSVVDIYVSTRGDPKQRHNPWRYLQQKVFLVSELHTSANVERLLKFQTAGESRAERRMKSVYGTKIEQDQFRNKTEKWEN